MSFSLLMIHRTPIFTLFPYTTLFRSYQVRCEAHQVRNEPFLTNNKAKPVNDEPEQAPKKAFFAASAKNRSEEHTSELQSPYDLVCRLLLEKKNTTYTNS